RRPEHAHADQRNRAGAWLASRAICLSTHSPPEWIQVQIKSALDEKMMVLDFWAHGMDIALKFTDEQIKAVRGLKEAIDATSVLPAAIGWDDETEETE
ncbi:hypothetical protein J4G37_16795, partial [Microvirga sp. 3-52]|nr:hypothetical protein [Microvirga sp. 3-52]